jgi:hypothetical protein
LIVRIADKWCHCPQDAYSTVKGRMSCVSAAAIPGSQQRGFSISEPLTTVGWGAPRGVDADKKAAVLEALQADAGRVPVAPDPYFFGKQVWWRRSSESPTPSEAVLGPVLY